MDSNLKIADNVVQPLSMHPKKFALWLFIVSVVMIFAALTSAYIVRQAEGNWVEFDLPAIMWTNTIIIILSSVTAQWAYIATKRNNLNTIKLMMTLTTVLGAAFLVGQYVSWGDLVARDVYLVGNPSGSFLYIFTGLHGFHLITGLIFLIIVLISAFRFKVHSKNTTQIEMCVTYWHFLGGLWIYLFLFLLSNH